MDRTAREQQWTLWLRAAIAGDDAAYRALLSALAVALRQAVRRGFSGMTANAGDVEDVVQEALLAIHLKRHTWEPDKPVTPWVMAIARNKMIDHLRRRGRRGEVSLELLPESADIATESPAMHQLDAQRVLSTLTERTRDIVQSITIEGLSAREVADKLGMSEVAVRVALHRGLKSLAKAFQETARP